ncbi:MAG TPA: ABC transporter ATP-binding protein [Capillimicrobium sp.]|nr:ABC transporter ATP-binding protein [Capillimicrobium sp.]
MPDEIIRVEGLRKAFAVRDGETLAIDDLTIGLRQGEFLSVVGPSGCGKTTLLRCIAGLLERDGGDVRYRGERVRGVLPGLQLVFQEFNRSLFPWLTVERNVRFPLHGLSRAEAAERARHALALVHLETFAGHYPWQLSGGMQQRVALARAIAARAELVLMDEPFASVDAQTRIALERVLLDVWRELGLSILFVTHDIEEAILLSDRVLVLSQRPSRVIAELDVDLPRPRDQLKTKELPRFQDLREEIFALLGLDRDELLATGSPATT